MDLKDYLGTTPGRIASVSLAMALASGAFVAFSGPGGQSALVMSSLIALAATGFIAALVLSLDVAPKMAFVMICALPPTAGVYLALMHLWRDQKSSAAGGLLAALAVVALAVAAVGGRRRA
jgi:hypothetical protein